MSDTESFSINIDDLERQNISKDKPLVLLIGDMSALNIPKLREIKNKYNITKIKIETDEEYDIDTYAKMRRGLDKIIVGITPEASELDKFTKIYERIGRNDDFFALGGNSLNAVSLSVECGIDGLTAQHIMMGKTPKIIAEKYEALSSVIKPALHKANEKREIYPLTNAQIYQLYECEKIGYTIDFNDWRGFWLLDEGIDIEKLKNAVVDTFNAHAGLNVNFNIKGQCSGEMIAHETWQKPSIEELDINPDDFKAYRQKKEKEKRDCLHDRLFELAILNVGAEKYLYININHFLHDESGLKLIIEEISERYETGQYTVDEEIDVFDLSLYEEEIKKTLFYSDAMEFYDKKYKKLSEANMIPKKENQISLSFRTVAESISRDSIENFFKMRGISEISYLQAAYSLALMSVFGRKEFTYMTVYDGRAEAKLRNMCGDLARSVYMVADWNSSETIGDYLNRVQEEYQHAIYYDIVDTVELSKKYPAMRNDVYINFRGDMSLDIKLEGKIAKQLPIGNSYEGDIIGTVLNFVIEFTPEKHYKVYGIAGFFDKQTLDKVIDKFEEMLIALFNSPLNLKVSDLLG